MDDRPLWPIVVAVREQFSEQTRGALDLLRADLSFISYTTHPASQGIVVFGVYADGFEAGTTPVWQRVLDAIKRGGSAVSWYFARANHYSAPHHLIGDAGIPRELVAAVSIEFFGQPAGWRSAGEEAEFRLGVDPGDAPPEVIADVLHALGELHRAAGGGGLVFRVDGEQVIANAEVGV